MRHATVYLNACFGHIAELICIVRLGEYGLCQILAHLAAIDIEGSHEVDVTYVVPADVGMHDAGDVVAVLGLSVIVNTLYQRGGAVANPYNRNVYLAGQLKISFLTENLNPGNFTIGFFLDSDCALVAAQTNTFGLLNLNPILIKH